ncbi:olee1-like protein [Vitis riparia]|uniref:olee1-like protein n=1 Tax=Vitis riparia TaxID=96939 RepID=UPI00155ACCC5|nr:olee1-like protein [Vitis riparia]
MARSLQAVILLATALCFLSFQASVRAEPHFFVKGQVYCDTCRIQFITRVSEYVPGAKVRLECRDREGGSVTYSIDGETDETGSYRLPVEGEHEEEVCEVQLIKSSKPECSEISRGMFARRSARISLASNNGMASSDRLANPLGFLRQESLSECPEVLKELGILPTGLI